MIKASPRQEDRSALSDLQISSQGQKSLSRLLAYSSKENIQINRLVRGNTQIMKNNMLDLSIDHNTENNDLNNICNNVGVHLNGQSNATGGSNAANKNYRRSSHEETNEIGDKRINVVVS